MFALKERVVYPGHGVAIINRIIEKPIAGFVTHFFELNFLNKDMMILVPVKNAESAGIRKLSSDEHINEALHIIAQPAQKTECQEITWNKRNREYHHKLRTGTLLDLSEVYRDLNYISTCKELSFWEKNLLKQTEQLLAEEISVAQEEQTAAVVAHMRSKLRSNKYI